MRWNYFVVLYAILLDLKRHHKVSQHNNPYYVLCIVYCHYHYDMLHTHKFSFKQTGAYLILNVLGSVSFSIFYSTLYDTSISYLLPITTNS